MKELKRPFYLSVIGLGPKLCEVNFPEPINFFLLPQLSTAVKVKLKPLKKLVS